MSWDDLFPVRGMFAGSAWCRHADRTADRPPAHVTVGAHGALPCYPLDAASPYVFCRTDQVVAEIAERTTGTVPAWAADLAPTLSCGGRNPGHSRLGVHPDLVPAARDAALDTLVGLAERRARDLDLASVGFLYVDADDQPSRAALRRAGYTELPSETAYLLDVPPGDFGAYLARFDYRHRTKINRDLRALREGGVTYRETALSEAVVGQLVPLEQALYRRHGTDADPATLARVLHSIAVHLGDDARVLLAEIDGAIAGFVLVLRRGRERYARQAGFDYARQGRLPLYFGLVYYELIRCAQLDGVTTVHYGTGADRAKLSRGCRALAQLAYVKAFDPALQARLADLAERGRRAPATS
ncbi:GNAT family N-acetyltransferase [Micromonospora sp. BQ11]|uniref:GNAT family N-acetyltransferase n=1 Tax=Micromonospora sp. BQ11 TaxID=3452212 RepID=UPI003F89762C